jgi:DNA-binding response OmpR family regulator
MLPDGDGALILVRARAARSPTRIAVLTCVVDFERLQTLQRLGAERVFCKPVDAGDLIAWVESAMVNSTDRRVRPPDDLPGLHLQ